MALQTNPDLLLSAFVRQCREIGGTAAGAKTFAVNLQRAALVGTSTAVDAVLSHAQDYSAGGVSAEGSSTQWLREMSALTLSTLCEAAIQRFESEIDATTDGLTGDVPRGDIRYADFSTSPSVFG